MLKRIRIRGKLLLLLATPLLALVVFAYLGVAERLDTADSQTREERLAQLADSGSDLSRAVAEQRLVETMVDAGAETDLDGWATLTRDATVNWLNSANAVRKDLTTAQARTEIDRLTLALNDRIAGGSQIGLSATTRLAELSLLSRSINSANRSLAAEAADLDLYRALFVQGYTSEMQDAATVIAMVGADSIRTGEVSRVDADLLDGAGTKLSEAMIGFQEQASPNYVALLAELRNSEILPRTGGGGDRINNDLQPFLTNGDANSRIEWLDIGLQRVDGIHAVSKQLLGEAAAAAAERALYAQQSAKTFTVLAGSVILGALLMAVLIGRSISRPLVRLSRSAEHLSTQELPALVESLKTGGREGRPDITPIVTKGTDEVAHLGRAISEIQKVTIEVAEEQTALLHRGISDMFVNLARRNQSLLERQIQFIDGLESTEEDPDQLENLFRLDHLATRMRRNAESLLVLAGGESSRRRGEPVGITSIIRVAISEIEDYARVDLRSIDDSLVPSTAAVDLAHLISELMENATQFSPPDSRVDVVGHRTLERSYQITIADHGIGLSDERLTESNRTLAEPAVVGLDLGRSLGFTVVSRLADRLGLTVRLTSTPLGGVTAVVSLPAGLLRDQEPMNWTVESAEADQPANQPSTDEPVDPGTDGSVPSSPIGHGADLFEIFGSNLPAPPPGPPEKPTAPALPRRVPAATTASTDTAVRTDLSAPELVHRTPGSTVATRHPTDSAADQPAANSARSPEQIREMLTRYRGGLQCGREATDDIRTDRNN